MQGTDVNLDVLLKKNFKSKELVRGRALMQAADEGIKNMKKAWLFAQKYLDEAGNPKISGDNSMESVVNKVLDDMWVGTKENPYETPKKKQRCRKMSQEIEVELEGEDDADDEEDKNDDSGENSDIKETSNNQLSDDCKPDCMFVGYVLLCYFLIWR